MENSQIISGVLFWLIIVTNIASERFGYKTFNDLPSEAKLQQISDNPNRYKVGFALILTEHICIVAVAVMLFVAFNSHNFMLAVVWVVARGGEGIIQIYYKKNYWGLLKKSRQYLAANGEEKKTLITTSCSILETKTSSFTFAQLLFSVGTLAYSIMFVVYGDLPILIGWFGIAASILYGFGNGMILRKSGFKVPLYAGGLLILIFEAVLGGWLIFSNLIQ